VKTIFTANLSTGAKQPAFSTNHMADIKHSYNQEQRKQSCTVTTDIHTN